VKNLNSSKVGSICKFSGRHGFKKNQPQFETTKNICNVFETVPDGEKMDRKNFDQVSA
jgi:hypothetical protein